MLTAKDIMVRDVITIHYSASIRELSRLLAENTITGIPVIDDERKLVGMISMVDLIREEVRVLSASPEHQDIHELFSPVLNMEDIETVSVRRMWVEEIMSRTLFTADESTTVRELCEIMSKNRVHRVPILKNGKLIGLVTAMRVISAVAEGNEI
jgi:predicted transcriptional regulator